VLNVQQDHHPNRERSVHHADLVRFLNQEDHAFLAQPLKGILDQQTDVTLAQQDQVQRKEEFVCNVQRVLFLEQEAFVYHVHQVMNQIPSNQLACHVHKDHTQRMERNVFLARLELTQQILEQLNVFHVQLDTLPMRVEQAAQLVKQDIHQWKEGNVPFVYLDPQQNLAVFVKFAQQVLEIQNPIQGNVHHVKLVGVPLKEVFAQNAQSDKNLILGVHAEIVSQVIVLL